MALSWALAWALLFTALHVYWYLGGTIGLGDAPSPLPHLVPTTLAGWIFEVVVVGMFAAGIAIPIVLLRGTPPRTLRRLLVALLWIGAVVLVARGASGLVDDLVRQLGVSDRGITGLTYQHTLGTPTPSTYTLVSTDAVDSYFLLGGILMGWAAARTRPRPARR
jgi:hypothetical protein